jgi:aspartyl-tRNA(Asn)/glutamyl-tRNA(Gln) amidotransferase subunit A
VRPTWGRVSRSGLLAFASSLDQIGPLTLTVRDAAVLLQAIAGQDAMDATTIAAEAPDWTAMLSGDIRGCRIGVPRHLFDAGVDDEVRAPVLAAIEGMRARGARVIDVTLEHASVSIPVYYLIATAEASSNLARYDGVRYGFRAPGGADLREMYEQTRREGFGAEVKRRIILGTFVLSAGYRDAYYVKAQRVRTLIARDLDAALDAADVLALPTSPTTAFSLGERTADPLSMYLSDVFTVGASLAGLPAMSVPCGFSRAGLPVGLQVVGRRGDEATMLRVADAVERDRNVWQQAPSGAGRDRRGA